MVKALSIKLDDATNTISRLEKEQRDNEKLIEQLQKYKIDIQNEHEMIKETYNKDKEESISKYNKEINALNMRLNEQNNKIEELTQKLNVIKTQTDYSSNNNEIVLGNLLNDSAISYNTKPTYIELENLLEDKEQLLQKKLQQEKSYEKTINELKNQISKFCDYESLKMEVICLYKNNEMLNKQIDIYKEKLIDNEKMYNEEIKVVNDEFIKMPL